MIDIHPETPRRAHVLIAEDDTLIRTFCERLLRTHHEVTAVDNGRTAFDLVAHGEVDLVLADLDMPLMNGMELLRRIRESYPDVDVIILTAHATVETARQALKLGAIDYLAKPIDAENLERTLRTALELQRMRREKERLSDLVITYQFSQLIATTLDSDTQLRQIAEFLWRRFTPETLALSLFDADLHQLQLLIARSSHGIAPRSRSATLPAEASEATLIRTHIHMVGGPGVDDANHFAGATLRIHDRPMGYLHITRSTDHPGFDADDRRMLGIFASQIAAALDNARLYRSLRDLHRQTIEALSEAIEARDSYTSGHSRQVTRYAARLAEVLGLPSDRVALIELAGLLHDVGKIGINDYILLKPGPLDPHEFEVMQQHPLIGVKILERVRGLWSILPLVRSHHERVDGRGYPDGLSGSEIPLEARILSVADSFEAMTADRAYRPAMSVDAALNMLANGAGSHWDREIVSAFITLIRNEGEQLKLPGRLKQRSVPLIPPEETQRDPDVRD